MSVYQFSPRRGAISRHLKYAIKNKKRCKRTMEIHDKPFGEIMKETRKQLGMTQKELAEALGVTHAHISRTEKGGPVSEHFKKLFERTFQHVEHKTDAEAEEKPFGEIVKETRKRLGLTQEQLALRLGIKQNTLSGIEKGAYNAGNAVKALFYERIIGNDGSASTDTPKTPAPSSTAGFILLEEIQAARSELGRPMLDIEIEAWKRASGSELLSESVLLREALELRSTRELLAGAQAFRKKRESGRKRDSIC